MKSFQVRDGLQYSCSTAGIPTGSVERPKLLAWDEQVPASRPPVLALVEERLDQTGDHLVMGFQGEVAGG
ncbi:hypothetical protein BN975_02837 [Mycolicibacterium farcinogenes]|nr:hypothetical protein BN975_02837 [Mycolicibacterium farcinogenes]